MRSFFAARKNYFKFLLAFLAIVLVTSGSYWVWDKYFSESGKARRLIEEQYKTYTKAEKAYIEAMTADTYGGKTPQETLDMFVEALRAGDVELASKYFLLDEDLSREKWARRLTDIKNRDLLNTMAADLRRAVTDPNGTLYDGDFGFVIYKSDGVVGAHVDMALNKHSQVWKIESL